MRNKEKPHRFKWADAVRKSDLPPTTKQVLVALSCYMKSNGQDCWPSYQLIAKDISRNRSTVIKHIQVAVELGWIIKKTRYDEHGDNTSNAYFPIIPGSGLVKQPPGSLMQPPQLQSNSTVVVTANPNNRINPITNNTRTFTTTEKARSELRAVAGILSEISKNQ